MVLMMGAEGCGGFIWGVLGGLRGLGIFVICLGYSKDGREKESLTLCMSIGTAHGVQWGRCGIWNSCRILSGGPISAVRHSGQAAHLS